tara:strand:- start:307 stop:483 length:177 start_codon:yes stop_codon:yes gene_type:complete
MHFTPTKLAETISLAAIMMPDGLLTKDKHRSVLKAEAIELINRAEQVIHYGTSILFQH